MGVLLSVGHGYVAQHVARDLLARGWRVIGTTRDAARADALRATGIEPLIWPLQELPSGITHLLSSVPPDADGDRVPGLLAGLEPAWAGYLSTSGVYGDAGGGWVDESSPLAATEPRSIARIRAEGTWAATGWPLHIFRVAGIYGPGRAPFAALRAGTARRIATPGLVTCRVHVADIARAVVASMLAPDPGLVVNLADDLPAPPQDVVAHAAELLGLPVPVLEDGTTAPMSPMLRSFHSASRRVANGRMKRLVGGDLICPDYRAGLAALLAAGE